MSRIRILPHSYDHRGIHRVTIKKDGLEVSISSHYDRAKRVREALKIGKLLYRLTVAHRPNITLRMFLWHPHEEAQGFTFADKDTDNQREKQGNSEKSAGSEVVDNDEARAERLKAFDSSVFPKEFNLHETHSRLYDYQNGVAVYVDDEGKPSIFLAGSSDGDFVGVFRDKSGWWSSKMENQSGNKEAFKQHISSVMAMLPEGAEFYEHSNVSADGLRVFAQQLKHGFVASEETYECGLNGADKANVLGKRFRDNGLFNSIYATEKDLAHIRKALKPFMEALGMSEEDVNLNAKGKVVLRLPVLVKSAKSAVSDEDSLSSKVAIASKNVNTNPTEGQKEAGNYKKGHVQVGTFDITIEQPEGSVRRGTDADGKQWESKMHNTYGYFRGTEGVDGDHIDVFLSTDIDGWNGHKVFVVDQYNPDGTFDEHKVMLGFNDMDEAKSDYLANYEKGWEDSRRIVVSATNLEDFEKWIGSSHRKTKPFSEYSSVNKETVANSPAKTARELPDAVNTDNQGNPINDDGTLKLDKVQSVDELTDDDFSTPKRNVQLPELPKNVNDAIGAEGKPVVIKKDIFEKNKNSHKDLSPEQSRKILSDALFHPNMYGQNQKAKRPYNWILIHNAEKHSAIIVEVNQNKDNVEIVNWHYLDGSTLKQKERQAVKEGGLILTLESAVGNTLDGVPSADKGTNNQREKQGNNKKSAGSEAEVAESPETSKQETNDSNPRIPLDNKNQAEKVSLAERIAKALGAKLVIVDHMEENGRFSVNKRTGERTITIARDAENPLAFVFGHESLHAVRSLSEEAYTSLRNAVKKAMGEKAWKAEVAKTKRMYSGMAGYDDVGSYEEEVVAEFLGGVMNDKGRMTRLADKLDHPAMSAIMDVLRKIRDFFHMNNMSAQERWTAQLMETVKDAYSLAAKRDGQSRVDRASLRQGEESNDIFAQAQQAKIEEFSMQHGVTASLVDDYQKSMKNENPWNADYALLKMRKELRLANRGMKLSEFSKVFKEFYADLSRQFGDVEPLKKQYVQAEMEQRGLMEAARKRAEEEERERQARLDELALLTDAEIDKQYSEALEKNDEAAAREMLDEAARRRGYSDAESAYQGVGAWAAPSNPGYESDEARREAVGQDSPDLNVEDLAAGYSNQPADIFEHPEKYVQGLHTSKESGQAIQAAIDAIKRGEKDVKVKVYRAVPTSVKEGKLRNGDWVTPSKAYAEMHGDNRLEGKYRLIEDEVPASELWWDGNDVNEWGYDNGKHYQYKNARNNRKLNDLVTRDDKGKVIPPSKRFNSRKADERYSLRQGEESNDIFAQAQEARDKEERALRDAITERIRQAGIEVITDEKEGQRVLDMANGRERDMSVKKKRALETASVSQDEKHQPTVVSSADGAKVLKELDSAREKYTNLSNRTKTFFGDVANALGAKRDNSASEYATFETKNGRVVTIRLSNHNATVSNFDNRNEEDGISIVVTPKKNLGLTNDGKAHVVEFFYDAIKLRRADGKPLAEILRSIKQALYSGEFQDTTGLAERQEVNAEDVVRYSFIGERGAASVDHAEEVTIRLDNLDVARQMEESGKDAKAIKMATGWERGGDGKWRYEIPDGEYDESISQGIHPLTELLKNDELFEAYPELKTLRVVFTDTLQKGEAGYYSWSRNEIVIATNSGVRPERVIAHEVQHAIQRIEGFARGGSSETIHRRISRIIEENNEYADYAKSRLQLWAEYKMYADRLDDLYKMGINSDNAWLKSKAIDAYWDAMNTLDDLSDSNFVNKYPEGTASEIAESGYHVEEAKKELRRIAQKIYDEIPKGNVESMELVSKLEQAMNTKDGYGLYNALGGEVEARNAERRMVLSPKERREILASKTEDVSRKDQIFLFDDEIASMAFGDSYDYEKYPRGRVEPNLADKEVKVVEANADHGFKNYKEAKTWAKQNVAKVYHNEETGGKGDVRISNAAIDKFMSQSAVDKSDNKDVHMAVLRVLPDVLKSSIDVETHPDFLKGEDGKRSVENGINTDVLVHRCYGAVAIDGKMYRVKITLKENAKTGETTNAHSYEATKIELLAGQHGDVTRTSPRNSNNSIYAAKLLQNVVMSYNPSEKVLDASEKRSKTVREHRVFHGSGAEFDHFDHSHMGEGEGAQAYGWGTYVTEVKSIGRTYAEQNPRYEDPSDMELEEAQESIANDIDTHYGIEDAVEELMYDGDGGFQDFTIKRDKETLERWRGYFTEHPEEWESYEDVSDFDLEDEDSREEFARQIEISIFDTAIDIARKYDDVFNGERRYLYTVEIPEDTGENYIAWDEPLSDEQIGKIRKYLADNYRKNKVEDFDASIAEVKDAPNAAEVNAWSRRGENIYKTLKSLLGTDKEASNALSEMGFTGIKYPADFRNGGREDGKKNYVIFNEDDAKITDQVRFFRGQQGEAYGFTVGGRIYIDPRIANAETPIHEYTHLWATALQQSDSKAWKNIVSLMKGTSVWNEVRKAYPELNTDEKIADEVLATYSGRRGAERLREEARKMTEGKDVFEMAEAMNVLDRVRQALRDFWSKVARMLHLPFTSAEEVADQVMRDLLDGKNMNAGLQADDTVREKFKFPNRGYGMREDGTTASIRALEAEEEGKYSKGKFQTVYKVARADFNVLNLLGVIDGSEWHHTGQKFTRTTFYAWANDAYRERYTENKKEIGKLVKQYEAADWDYWKEEYPFHSVYYFAGHKFLVENPMGLPDWKMYDSDYVDEKLEEYIANNREALEEEYEADTIEKNAKLKEAREHNAQSRGKEYILLKIADVMGMDKEKTEKNVGYLSSRYRVEDRASVRRGEVRDIFQEAQQARDEEETRFSLRNNNQGSGWSREAMQQAWDRAMSRAEPEAFVKEYLLPPFDEYLIGYKSRELSLSPEHTHNAHTNNDIFFPIIAHDGIICGNWTPWEKNLNTSFLLSQSEELTFDKQWKAFCQLNKRWNAKCLST